jgi:hypothetical protein
VDAKGVSKLYRSTVRPLDLILLTGAALVTVSVAIMISSPGRSFVALLLLKVRTLLGLS